MLLDKAGSKLAVLVAGVGLCISAGSLYGQTAPASRPVAPPQLTGPMAPDVFTW